MKPNPFRVTLVVLGIGLMGLGALIWLISLGASANDSGSGPAIGQSVGSALMSIGWLPFIAWLVVGALQHVPVPAEPKDTRSEDEIAAWVKEQRQPKKL